MRLRRYLIALLALGGLGVIVAVAVISQSRTEPLAELRVREGTATVQRGSGEAIEASEGEDLSSGDIVATTSTGRAAVEFFDGSVTRLDTNAKLVLRTLKQTQSADTIELALDSGRAWHNVADLADNATYSVDVGAGTVSVEGTTFLTDCTSGSSCYVVGFDGSATAETDAGRSVDVGPGDCVVVDDGGRLEDCDERKLGLIDGWVRENLAEDQQLELERVESSASPSPTATTGSNGGGPRPAPDRTAAPTVALTSAPTAAPSEEPGPSKTKKPDTPEPTEEPVDRTPRPTPF